LNDEPLFASNELDNEIREIVELGLDPDFLSSLPQEMRVELINNARRELQPPGQHLQPEELDLATLIEI
jgi:hypothetical protein